MLDFPCVCFFLFFLHCRHQCSCWILSILYPPDRTSRCPPPSLGALSECSDSIGNVRFLSSTCSLFRSFPQSRLTLIVLINVAREAIGIKRIVEDFFSPPSPALRFHRSRQLECCVFCHHFIAPRRPRTPISRDPGPVPLRKMTRRLQFHKLLIAIDTSSARAWGGNGGDRGHWQY